MGRILELIVMVNALGGIGAVAARIYRGKQRRSNLEHVRELERENAEIDRLLGRHT